MYCDVVRRGPLQTLFRYRDPKIQQSSIENRSKTSISSSSICSVGHFQIETCPPFLPQNCPAVMPHLSPHPFRVELHHGRRHGCRCNRWLNCNMAGFMAMLISVGIHNPRRNPTGRWTSVFAMIAVAQPSQWLRGKSPSGSIFMCVHLYGLVTCALFFSLRNLWFKGSSEFHMYMYATCMREFVLSY